MMITIRGVDYASVKEAAKAMKVSGSTIYFARANGTLETVGLGLGNTMPVKIRGKTYPSVKAAAKALKVASCTLSIAISRNRLDTVGIGPGRGKRPSGGKTKSNPITILGVIYPSLFAASAAMGRCRGWVQMVIARHGLERAMPRLEARAKQVKQEAMIRAMAETARNEQAQRAERFKVAA
jgi:hypothetical protein